VIHHLSVPGIKSASCADVIRKAVNGLDPSADCKVDIEGKRVQLTSSMMPSDFVEALEDVGYAAFVAQV
jgi:copper chaperone CopZ